MKKRALLLSFLASFFIYLLPIFGPHAGWLVGQLLFHRAKDPQWQLANWALALATQGLVFLWFLFCSRFTFSSSSGSRFSFGFRTGLRLIAVPAAWVLLFIGYMQVIPMWRLVESDSSPEKHDLTEVCHHDGTWITLSGQFDRALVSEPRSEILLQNPNSQKYYVLHAPDCKVTQLDIPRNTPERVSAPVGIARGGRILYAEAIHGQSLQNYGLFLNGAQIPLEPFRGLDPSKVSPPKLSPDGGAVAWIVRSPGKPGELKTAALFASGLREGSHFDLSTLGLGSYDVIDVTEGAREVLLARNLREYLLVSSSGKVVWQLTPEAGVRPILGTLRITAGATVNGLRDYMAWEGYRDEGRYVVQWRRGGQVVKKEIPLGRSISSADASRDGRYIAASTSPAVSLGKIEDTLVIWSSDGKEVFRKRLGPYNRAPVVFLEGNLVAYSELNSQGVGVTRVLKLW